MSDASQYFFILTLSGLALSFFTGTIIYCLKSKCSEINLCCGLLVVKRDVEGEEKIENNEIEHNLNPYPQIELNNKV